LLCARCSQYCASEPAAAVVPVHKHVLFTDDRPARQEPASWSLCTYTPHWFAFTRVEPRNTNEKFTIHGTRNTTTETSTRNTYTKWALFGNFFLCSVLCSSFESSQSSDSNFRIQNQTQSLSLLISSKFRLFSCLVKSLNFPRNRNKITEFSQNRFKKDLEIFRRSFVKVIFPSVRSLVN
jgi:hypothetical protein